ncbi:MAG: sulfatase-like hydrolase/transferase [Proteobacteria bacterium]|nr:sulfatase-like hydrolase/transferase [Pseudomonadota bacterium]
MRKVLVWLFVFSLVVVTTSAASSQGREGEPRNIILIGWDGAQKNHVNESLDRGELPNLKRLSSEGALVAIDILRVTDTKAGWAQILTGYEPEVTGVFGNKHYEPIPKGYTVFERLEEFFGPDNFVTAAVIGKKENVDAGPPERVPVEEKGKGKGKAGRGKMRKREGKIIVEGGVKYRLIPGKPYYHAKESMDVFINGLIDDEKVGYATLGLLLEYKDKPFFFFVHFAEVDHKGHKYGENSEEYNEALKSADFWTGKIMKKLNELKLYDKTLIYVTADHGFDEGGKGHGDAPYVFLATNDSQVIRRGERAEIAPTILDRFGLDLAKIKPPLDGRPLTKRYDAPIW